MSTKLPQFTNKTTPQEPVERELGKVLIRTLTAYMTMQSVGLLEKNSASK